MPFALLDNSNVQKSATFLHCKSSAFKKQLWTQDAIWPEMAVRQTMAGKQEGLSSDELSFDAMYCNLCQKWVTKGRNNSKVWNSHPVRCRQQTWTVRDAVFKEMAEDHGIDVAFDKKKEFDALKVCP